MSPPGFRECPVCDHGGTPVDSDVCSQCGADLKIFEMLDDLESAGKSAPWFLAAGKVLVIAFLGAAVGGLSVWLAFDDVRRTQPADLVEIVATDSLNSRILKLRKSVRDLQLRVNAPTHIQYTVHRGESLRGIAARIYGSEDRYVDIVDANKRSIDNPSLIFSGQVLRIPIIDEPS